ncbi:hypothetical protein O3Q52_38255 [Streptomyces sp. ActVer]|uniref:hypothetical protein n=1 Tax=Streptomyces sp. ActVer TaxID=3014558 RepID=UPI0022B3E7C8|nr:hypothetical protein [Streptomyces sp. ActVer]MCZ4513881.1 hypothetical protein [Streptomyces sp. ActVer]
MTGAVYEVPPEVLVLLHLPPLDKQSEQQLRGRVCVWCPVTLTAETAMDLGARRHRRQDSHYVTFPRGCRHCTARAAKRALHDHAPRCEQCVDDASRCTTRTALHQLTREEHR